ncbi:50S ribosomal protein L22 [Orientia tsutsugamushi str. Gilliam]|uniref:Large ribosomal subunit protein uL22 n=1 Tax=Orientia tsutsugamushi str. Gilliam TaxID=1359184 RepID=A0A2U3RF72_ORITS|nr:50S ribosomal protein L22 [Orientia tsutsugamushi]SPR11863.1 50S ribosomal protein L22 [Orientia tsutsugamushi str. Gilliam]
MFEAKKFAKATLRMIKVSPRKLNLITGLIRNLKVSDAIMQLKFSKKRAAVDVKKCLQSAIANAENNDGLDIDNLVVLKAIVGKGSVMKRLVPRARGKAFRIKKFFSNLYITVSEIK